MDWKDRARAQAGVIGRCQLLASGLTHSQVDGLVARRDLVAVLPQVYSARSSPRTSAARWWAATLWSGGVLSHRSAARVWQLPALVTTTSHVTVSDLRYRGRAPGVRVHRVQIDMGDVTQFGGLSVTTRERTVIDLLRSEPLASARSLLDRAIQVGWIDVATLHRAIQAGPGRAGNVRLRQFLADLDVDVHAESERRLHRLLRQASISGWLAQYRIDLPGGRVALADLAFPEQRLVIEVDGRRHHGQEAPGFEADRERQNALMALGWRVLRFTWQMITQRPEYVLAQILQFLAVSGRRELQNRAEGESWPSAVRPSADLRS